MKVVYHHLSLFNAPKGACIIHATNCQGKWGRGIAGGFAKLYPNAYKAYAAACAAENQLGKSLLLPDGDHIVGCLSTSFHYGPGRIDPPEKILQSTRSAVEMILRDLPPDIDIGIYSNKFNSGLFAVPWALTEQILLEVEDPRTWNVCDYNPIAAKVSP